jgi:hypothetical protein
MGLAEGGLNAREHIAKLKEISWSRQQEYPNPKHTNKSMLAERLHPNGDC